jgi:hypothetical protein
LSAASDTVILKVETIYILYNRAKGFNADTRDLPNKLSLVHSLKWESQIVMGLDMNYPGYFTRYQDGHLLIVDLCEVVEGDSDSDDS